MVKLFDKRPIVLDRYLATIIGLNEAIVLQQIHYWLELNKKNKRNYHEGKYWTYNAISKWQEEFPFWSVETVKRTFKRLRDADLIMVGNFNVYQFDRTLWYTINYEELENVCNERLEDKMLNDAEIKDATEEVLNDESKGSNGIQDSMHNKSMEHGKKPSPIPEIISEINAGVCNQSVCQSKDTLSLAKNKDGLTDGRERFNKSYESIIEKCELHSIDIKYRDGVKHAIRLILMDISNSKYIKIGSVNISADAVYNDIKKLNFFIVEHAVNKFKKASKENKISNTIAYLKACIYNAIHEIDIDMDSGLRYERLIE